MYKKLLPIIILVVIVSLLLLGCNEVSVDNYAFGTYYSLELNGKDAKNISKNIDSYLTELDNALSTSITTSDVYRINNSTPNSPVSVSKHTIELYKRCVELYQNTEGAFNFTIFPLVELWHFSPDTFIGVANAIPTNEEILELLPYCTPNNFVLDEVNSTITRLNDRAKIDFGGIAKGYACDEAFDISKSLDKVVVDIGRTLKVAQATEIYILNPKNDKGYVARFTLDNKAVSTSGSYERRYTYNDVNYHHIIDKNGYPTGINEENPIISVTVVGESATLCDVYSTTVMVMGIDNATPLLTKDGYSAFIVRENDTCVIGENIFEKI